MKTAMLAILIVTLAASACANRQLHIAAPALAPVPAPGPSNCPAPKSPGSNCVVEATQFQSVCASFITSLNSATGGKVIATTDAQIQALVAQMAAKQETPSAECCTAAISLFSDACACDANVQAVAQATEQLSPSGFQTVGSVFLVACNTPTCYDTCRLPSATAGN